MDDKPKRKRGRPRIHPEGFDYQAAWKKRTEFERSERRRKYKAEKARQYRQRKKQEGDQK